MRTNLDSTVECIPTTEKSSHKADPQPSKSTKNVRKFVQYGLTSQYLQYGDLVLISIPEDLEVLHEIDPCLNGRMAFIQHGTIGQRSLNENDEVYESISFDDEVLVKLKPIKKKPNTEKFTTRRRRPKWKQNRSAGPVSEDEVDDDVISSLDDWMYEQYMQQQLKLQQKQQSTIAINKSLGASMARAAHVARDIKENYQSPMSTDLEDYATEREQREDFESFVVVPKFCLCLEDHILRERINNSI